MAGGSTGSKQRPSSPVPRQASTTEPDRIAIVAACKALEARGLVTGTSGNISVRHGAAMLITPSGIPYDALQPADIAVMDLSADERWEGPKPPSSEWRFHRDILRQRPDVGAVVHTHAPYATMLAMLRRPIPAAHYMIALFGGADIRCTDYAPYGTQELSNLAVEGLRERYGVLLGSHGMIAVGASLDEAMWRAGELETLARLYHGACLLGEPVILSDDAIATLVQRFRGYRPAAAGDGSR